MVQLFSLTPKPGKSLSSKQLSIRKLSSGKLPDQQRLERVCEWRLLIKAENQSNKKKDNEKWKKDNERRSPTSGPADPGPADPGPADEEAALREMTAHREQVSRQHKQAQAAFWSHLADFDAPSGMHFLPNVELKWFTARECLLFPLQEAARVWFRWLSEERELEQIIQSAPTRKRSQRKTLTKIRCLHDQYESADQAWEMHVALCSADNPGQAETRELDLREPELCEPELCEPELCEPELCEPELCKLDLDMEQVLSMDLNDLAAHLKSSKESTGFKPSGPAFEPSEPATDYLAAWAAAQIGEVYLRPLMARSRPAAGPEQLRQELLLDIWGATLVLNPGRLPVRDFCHMPATVARSVRSDYSDTSDHVERLVPATQRALLEASRLAASLSAPDPEKASIEKDMSALLFDCVQALPSRQRQAICLAAEGYKHREIAEKMKCGVEAVKTHLERGRRRLRDELKVLFE